MSFIELKKPKKQTIYMNKNEQYKQVEMARCTLADEDLTDQRIRVAIRYQRPVYDRVPSAC